MVDLTNLLNAMKTTPGPSKTEGSERIDGVAKELEGTFAAILKASAAGKTAARSGNSLPFSGNSLPDQADTGDLESVLLEKRALKSGLKVLVAGSEPSNQAITEFAVHQGIDPKALQSLLEKDLPQQPVTGRDITTPSADKATSAEIQALSLANGLADSEDLDNIAALLIDQQSIIKPSTSTVSGALNRTPSPVTSFSDESKLANQQNKTLSQTQGADTADNLKQAMLGNKAESKSHAVATEWLNSLKNASPMPGADLVKNSQKELATSVTKGTLSTDSKAPMQQTSAIKLMLKVSDNELKKMPQMSVDKQTAPLKLAPISLLSSQSNIISPIPETGILPLQTSLSESGERGFSQTLNGIPAQDIMKRRDHFNALSHRLSEALGQRITAQVARGEWRVEMELHPRSLGRIEIQLEMKNGELEANFYTANSVTKELISESLPRLRLALEQHGMESAYKGLEQGNNGKSDGNSTGQNSRGDQVAKSQSQETDNQTQTQRKTDDGLDILI